MKAWPTSPRDAQAVLEAVRTGQRYIRCLAAPGVGLLHNGTHPGLHTLADRVANREAFPGEFEARIPVRAFAANARDVFLRWRS